MKDVSTKATTYTIHSQRNRQLQGLLGVKETLLICRVRCQNCKAVFTVLPSFILRYRRQDADCLGKLLEMNLGMGLTLRETATLYSWMRIEHGWQPSWVWSLVQWLGHLLPVSLLLMRMASPHLSIYCLFEHFEYPKGIKCLRDKGALVPPDGEQKAFPAKDIRIYSETKMTGF